MATSEDFTFVITLYVFINNKVTSFSVLHTRCYLLQADSRDNSYLFILFIQIGEEAVHLGLHTIDTSSTVASEVDADLEMAHQLSKDVKYVGIPRAQPF